MTPRDLSEIKRRLDPNKRNPATICGCHVSDDGEVLTTFRKPVAMLPQEEMDRYMALFRKALSGIQGQNLLPVALSEAATGGEPCFENLYTLRQTRLQSEEAVQTLFGSMMAWLQDEKASRPQTMDASKLAASYLILLLDDAFDEYHRRRDGEEDRERSDTLYTYVLCCVCPVKPRKPELAWRSGDFSVTRDDWVVAAPELGFLYPAREQGASDVYTAVYYTRNIADLHEGFAERVFGTVPGMPASEQRDALRTMLQETLAEECSMDVMQQVHDRVSDMIRDQKEDKNADPLTMNVGEITQLLDDCGVSREKTKAFAEEYGEVFGQNTEVSAVNLVSPREFKVATPSVSIRVDPAHKDLVSTRVIDGQRCIVILADGAVEVNGVNIALGEE